MNKKSVKIRKSLFYIIFGLLSLVIEISVFLFYLPVETRFSFLTLFFLGIIVFSSLILGIISYWAYSTFFYIEPQKTSEEDLPQKIDQPLPLDFSDMVLSPNSVISWYETYISHFKGKCLTMERVANLLSVIDPFSDISKQLRLALYLVQEIFSDYTIAVYLPNTSNNSVGESELRLEIASKMNANGSVEYIPETDPIIDELKKIIFNQVDINYLKQNNWNTLTFPWHPARIQTHVGIFPLSVWSKIHGFIVFSSNKSKPLSSSEQVLANIFSRQLGIYLENHFLYNENIYQQRLLHEIELARKLQMAAIPQNTPPINGYDIAGVCIPSNEISGDYYDLILLPNNTLVCTIADVAGKGLAAAIFLSKIQTLVRAIVDTIDSPSKLLTFLSKTISKENTPTLYATMTVVYLRPNSSNVILSSAGHCRPLIVRTKNGYVEEYQPEVGIPLGLFDTPEFDYPENQITLMPSDGILLFTDGITDALNSKHERFGLSRLRLSLEKGIDLPSTQMVKQLISDLNNFKGSKPLEDDTTLLYIKWQPTSK